MIPIMSIVGIIPYIQIILSVLLMGGILLQQSEAGLGALGGGDGFSSGYHTKRGAERTLFITTIVIAVLFAATSFILLLI